MKHIRKDREHIDRVFYFFLMFIFILLLKVTFHLQLLQNTGHIFCIVQYILEPTLRPCFLYLYNLVIDITEDKNRESLRSWS